MDDDETGQVGVGSGGKTIVGGVPFHVVAQWMTHGWGGHCVELQVSQPVLALLISYASIMVQGSLKTQGMESRGDFDTVLRAGLLFKTAFLRYSFPTLSKDTPHGKMVTIPLNLRECAVLLEGHEAVAAAAATAETHKDKGLDPDGPRVMLTILDRLVAFLQKEGINASDRGTWPKESQDYWTKSDDAIAEVSLDVNEKTGGAVKSSRIGTA